MKRTVSLLIGLALAFSMLAPALAGEQGEQVELSGWITDEYCGKANANAEGKGCALACAKKGAQLVLYSNEKIYKLSDQEGAKQHVGHEVVVHGVLAEDGTVKVSKFQKKEDKKA